MHLNQVPPAAESRKSLTDHQDASAQDYLPILPTDHVRGRSDAPLTLFEFGDYECPGCRAAYFDILKLQTTFGDRLQFAFRHYPYAKIHPHAELAAQAAEAASAQGKFWEMHELLFSDQSRLKLHDLLGRAETLALDLKRFKAELNDEVYLEQIRADFRTGVQNGVYSTPGIFINGIRVNGDADFESLRRDLDQALEEGSGTPSGTP
jgi:protein-disulfide isomerase